ncbi:MULTISPECIES: TPM domain-containing protein [Clostridium]|uniref:TPM domain-containing protein n=1 Tax=Clostridium cibarium TaxID=2762247 RepID=A0ABR8PNR9_9CLOT|nr:MULTISPECIES: TPM domain-containing protein [Clostridium]MBD7909760.1 TPM domain-containing protein [Clostridium cibarium]
MNVNNRFIQIFISSLLIITSLFYDHPLAADSFPIPTSYKYINDYTNTITDEEKRSIISIGKELEDKTGSEATIVILDSTNNIPIESYANNLFRTWQIGQKEKDNGLLILVALRDRTWRVEVGRGLEGALPDVLTSRVMDSLAKPKFIEGNYGKGLLDSYSTLCDYIAKEYGVTLDKSLNITLPTDNNLESKTKTYGITFIVMLGLFFMDLLFNRGRISYFLLQLLFINAFSNRHGPGDSSGGGGFGGFGGGSSSGGGSSGNW